MLKKVGYARVFGSSKNIIQQMQILKGAGCKYIFSDQASSIRETHKLREALEHLNRGDILVVYKLNVLGYSINSLIDIIRDLQQQGIGLKSLQDNIDTTNASSEMIFRVFSSLAEYERDIIQKRTQVGLAAARARGKNGGRPKALAPRQIATIRKLHADKRNTITSICKTFKISRPTLYAYLKQ